MKKFSSCYVPSKYMHGDWKAQFVFIMDNLHGKWTDWLGLICTSYTNRIWQIIALHTQDIGNSVGWGNWTITTPDTLDEIGQDIKRIECNDWGRCALMDEITRLSSIIELKLLQIKLKRNLMNISWSKTPELNMASITLMWYLKTMADEYTQQCLRNLLVTTMLSVTISHHSITVTRPAL